MTVSQADGSGYFLYHSIGQYPGKAAEMARATAEFAAVWGAFDDDQWPRALQLRQGFMDAWGQVIGAAPGSLTTAENVTSALYSLIGGLPRSKLRGKRVLVAQDCFPSLHFMLAGIAEQFEFTLDTVPLRQGAAWVEDEDFIAAWGEDVGLALLTWVTSTASHRCDLEALVAHGRAMGSVIGVDITQGAGLFAYDVNAPAVDFTLSTSLKWLCGTSGAGILQVAGPLLMECAPELRGWFSQPNPFSWDLDAFEYAPDARRFDHGTPSVLALAASLPALQRNLAGDGAARLAHNREMSAQIIALADELGLALGCPRDPEQRGGSVMVKLGAPERAAAVVGTLKEAQVFVDTRGGTLRLSPGEVTDRGGIARLAQVLRG
ncbi:MAG: aminotransferase class V-fold PLP-dependent enzyme [Sulfitobacter sp.]